MNVLEESTRLVMEEYRRRFNEPLDISLQALDIEQRSRLVAALERALQRNIALHDYELQEFEVSRRRRIWLALRRAARWLAGRHSAMV